jgi:hypothetical protein
MKCPVCKESMSACSDGNESLHHCPRHGQWMPFTATSAPVAATPAPFAATPSPAADGETFLRDFLDPIVREFTTPARLKLRPWSGRDCLECGQPMAACHRGPFQAELCAAHGLWIATEPFVAFCTRALLTIREVAEQIPPPPPPPPPSPPSPRARAERRAALIAAVVERLG